LGREFTSGNEIFQQAKVQTASRYNATGNSCLLLW